MRAFQVALAIVGAFLFQTLGGRYLGPAQSYLDLFLITAAGFGLMQGATVGMVTGTVAGLVQDAFSGGLLGLNGLSKTIVGYIAGIAGRRLILRGAAGRFVFFVLATLTDVLILTLVGSAADKTVLGQESSVEIAYLCLGNGLAGAIAMALVDRSQRSRMR